jgi:hypothetical protein
MAREYTALITVCDVPFFTAQVKGFAILTPLKVDFGTRARSLFPYVNWTTATEHTASGYSSLIIFE